MVAMCTYIVKEKEDKKYLCLSGCGWTTWEFMTKIQILKHEHSKSTAQDDISSVLGTASNSSFEHPVISVTRKKKEKNGKIVSCIMRKAWIERPLSEAMANVN